MLVDNVHAVMKLDNPVSIKDLSDDLIVRYRCLIQQLFIKKRKLLRRLFRLLVLDFVFFSLLF